MLRVKITYNKMTEHTTDSMNKLISLMNIYDSLINKDIVQWTKHNKVKI